MTARKRLAALQLMDRMKQHEIETLGAALSALRATQSELDQQSIDLRDEAIREASSSTIDTRKFLPGYLKSVETQRRALADQRDALEEEAATAESELLLAFRDAKTNEMVLGRVVQEISLEDERAQVAEQDDASRALYLMHRGAGATG